jgi:hypothetical protein
VSMMQEETLMTTGYGYKGEVYHVGDKICHRYARPPHTGRWAEVQGFYDDEHGRLHVVLQWDSGRHTRPRLDRRFRHRPPGGSQG